MITAIDTNILVDILEPDPKYGPISRDVLKRCFIDGAVIACEVVWAEIVTAYGNASEKVINELKRIGIEYSAMSLESAIKAAECWHRYRQQGGSRSRIAADFLIGGHALVQSNRLLTRDNGFYRDYFGSLNVLSS